LRIPQAIRDAFEIAETDYRIDTRSQPKWIAHVTPRPPR